MKKVYLAHNVCLNSSYDFNIVKSALQTNDFILIDNIAEADTCIYAGCGVRGVWVDNAISEINNAIKHNKDLEVIATGCFSSIDPSKILKDVKTKKIKLMSFNTILNDYANSSIEELDKNLSQTESLDYEGSNKQRKRINELKQSIIDDLQKIDKEYNLNITQKYKESTKGFVFYNEGEQVENITITRGCPYNCSYCSIPLGRGGQYTSVPLGNIIEKVEKALKRNVRHVLLLGDEIGNFGLGTNEMDISKLLNILVQKYDLNISIRYIEPKPFLMHYETIKKYCDSGKIKLLYIPIQSGSNRILKLMNRTYKIDEDIIEKITYLRKNTSTTLYTNWMVGFNSETDEDFQETVKLVEKLNCQINMVIPFSERPNTSASIMGKKITVTEKRNRHGQLFEIIKNMKSKQFNELLVDVDKAKKDKLLIKIMDAENYFLHID